MKILMLAPEPFFQPRGTPISVYFRLKALSAMGHKVDLITYPLGRDKLFPGLKIIRVPRLPGLRRIKIGPSFVKIPLDLMMAALTLARLAWIRYDLVFSHEEAAFFGAFFAKCRRVPHVYDMHSSLPQQLDNFKFTRSDFIKGVFRFLEKFVLKNSASVIVICPDLYKQVERMGFSGKSFLLENFCEFDCRPLSQSEKTRLRSRFAASGQKLVLYTGNFESYQGIDLFLRAAAGVRDLRVIFLLVGGTPEEVREKNRMAGDLGIAGRVHFTGQVPPSRVPHYIEIADVLASPRTEGTNTPLKIYSFLKSGKPTVATDLWTHTQVLDENIAVLGKPEPEKMAAAVTFACFHPEAKNRAEKAAAMAAERYSFSRYKNILAEILRNAGEAGGSSQ